MLTNLTPEQQEVIDYNLDLRVCELYNSSFKDCFCPECVASLNITGPSSVLVAQLNASLDTIREAIDDYLELSCIRAKELELPASPGTLSSPGEHTL